MGYGGGGGGGSGCGSDGEGGGAEDGDVKGRSGKCQSKILCKFDSKNAIRIK